MPYQETLDIISDNLIDSKKITMVNLDVYKEQKKLTKFRSVDGIKIISKKIIFAEFKKCDLFYKTNLNDEERKIVNGIIDETPEKIVDSFMVLLPKYLSEEMKCILDHKIDIEIVLGSEKGYGEDPMIRMRMRELIKMEGENYKELNEKVQRYRGTYFINEIKIRTKEEFQSKYKV
ncbi:MAG: hypothetical protein ACRC5S_00285 [Cetobacterium sp.]